MSTLEELRDLRRRELADSDHLAAQAAELDARADDRFAEAGAYLVPRRAWWRPPAELTPWLAEAEGLVARIRSLDERVARLQQSGEANPSLPPWFQALRGKAVGRERARAAARLRTALVTIARVGVTAGADAPDVAPILEEAAELQARARHLRFSLSSVALRLTDLQHEIERREQAERLMGFDSLHMMAYFTQHGLPVIDSPYELAPGEVAYLATEASLSLLPPGSRYTPGGSAVIPPAAVTGIQHWIGAFRERPAPAVAETDVGVLFLSSQRLAFAGTAESTAIWLDAVVDMDVYRDAIAVLHLGAEKPILLRVPAPGQVAFYVNWAMRSALAASRRGE